MCKTFKDNSRTQKSYKPEFKVPKLYKPKRPKNQKQYNELYND